MAPFEDAEAGLDRCRASPAGRLHAARAHARGPRPTGSWRAWSGGSPCCWRTATGRSFSAGSSRPPTTWRPGSRSSLGRTFDGLEVRAVTGEVGTRSGARGRGARRRTAAFSWRPTACPRASTSRSTSTRSCTTTCPGTRPASNSGRAGSTASASRAPRSRRCCSTAPTTRSTRSCSTCSCARPTRSATRSASAYRCRPRPSAWSKRSSEACSCAGRAPGCRSSSPSRRPEVSRLHEAWEPGGRAREGGPRVLLAKRHPARRGRARARGDRQRTRRARGGFALSRRCHAAIRRFASSIPESRRPYSRARRARGEAQGTDRPRFSARDHPRRSARSGRGRRRSGWPSSGQMLVRVSLAGRWLRGRLV